MTGEAAPTVATVLDGATRRLREAGVPNPSREAASLLALVLGTDRGGVAARKPDPLAAKDQARFAAMLASRALRTPLQHLAGHAEFRGLEFAVNRDVLIPRPETEDLVQAVIDAGLPVGARIADLGTGSGCISVALAVASRSWRIVAVDRSAEALSVAARNAARHGVEERVTIVERDFGVVPDDERGVYDAVVSNPPYVSEEEWRGLDAEVRDHEPKLALVPGPTGIEAYGEVVRAAAELLACGGWLALELGWRSEAAVRACASAAGFERIVVRPDFRGIPRVLTARR